LTFDLSDYVRLNFGGKTRLSRLRSCFQEGPEFDAIFENQLLDMIGRRRFDLQGEGRETMVVCERAQPADILPLIKAEPGLSADVYATKAGRSLEEVQAEIKALEKNLQVQELPVGCWRAI